MKITIERINQAVHMRGVNEDGNTITMDGAPDIGGEGLGVRPMQLLLMSLGGCTSIDVLSMLSKMKQTVTTYSMEVEGQRDADSIPAVFTGIHLTYRLDGKGLIPGRVLRATELSVTKYCSVSKMLERSAEITYSVILNGEQVR